MISLGYSKKPITQHGPAREIHVLDMLRLFRLTGQPNLSMSPQYSKSNRRTSRKIATTSALDVFFEYHKTFNTLFYEIIFRVKILTESPLGTLYSLQKN